MRLRTGFERLGPRLVELDEVRRARDVQPASDGERDAGGIPHDERITSEIKCEDKQERGCEAESGKHDVYYPAGSGGEVSRWRAFVKVTLGATAATSRREGSYRQLISTLR